jgi:negative regulator of replication initiation
MVTVQIDDDVWVYLQSKARPFEDTPNDVLRRELKIGSVSSETPRTFPEPEVKRVPFTVSDPFPTINSKILPPDKDYTHRMVRGYRLNGTHNPVRSYKEVLIGVASYLYSENPTAFENVSLDLHGKSRNYFSRDPNSLKFAEALGNSGLFVETNLNSNLIVGICRTLLQKLGHRVDQLQVE